MFRVFGVMYQPCILIEKYRRCFFKRNFVFFDILPRLFGIPAKLYFIHNYIILLISLSSSLLGKIILEMAKEQSRVFLTLGVCKLVLSLSKYPADDRILSRCLIS